MSELPSLTFNLLEPFVPSLEPFVPPEGEVTMARCEHPSFCIAMKRCMGNCDGDSPLIKIYEVE